MPDKIKRVIVLMMENRSFDHVVGSLKRVIPELEGIPNNSPPNTYNGQAFPQQPGAARFVQFDPHHERRHVKVQMQNGNGGFVLDYAHSYPDANPTTDWPEVMKYHDLNTLPAIHTLAQNFTICDHWYASVPGPTWCNRLFALSGTSLGRVEMPEGIMSLNLHWYNQPTLFDRLNERGISWKVYFGDAPLSFLFVHQWQPENIARHRQMTEFYRDVADYDPAQPDNEGLPFFSFIEPQYFQPDANDAHPPHDIFNADALVGTVYNAIRANPKLWNEVLLVVAFDEHGGFYDHVTPPATVPPDLHQEEFDNQTVRSQSAGDTDLTMAQEGHLRHADGPYEPAQISTEEVEPRPTGTSNRGCRKLRKCYPWRRRQAERRNAGGAALNLAAGPCRFATAQIRKTQ